MRVMAVEFRRHGRLRYVDAADLQVSIGEQVVVATEQGPEVARCVWGPSEIELDAVLPVCTGVAGASDLERHAEANERRAMIRATAEQLIARHRLPMTVLAVDDVEADSGPGRLAVVYFRAPHRVDFRALVSDLARVLQGRVDLRQVGPRDAAALVGGIGPCGRELCCCLLCPVKEPMPGRISRDQEAANGALQLAGSCGRMKCCLAHEADAYADYFARSPRVGSVVATPGGEGVVSGHVMPLDAVWVRSEEGTRSVPLGDVQVVRQAPGHDVDSAASEPVSDPARPVPRPPERRAFLRRPGTRRADG